MIIRASNFPHDEESGPIDHELNVLINDREQLLSDLPKRMQELVVVEDIAMGIHALVRQVIENPAKRSDMVNAGIVRRERDRVRSLINDESKSKEIACAIKFQTVLRKFNVKKKERQEVLRVCNELIPLYLKAYLLHIIEELEELLQERVRDEEIYATSLVEPEMPNYDDPLQIPLFPNDLLVFDDSEKHE